MSDKCECTAREALRWAGCLEPNVCGKRFIIPAGICFKSEPYRCMRCAALAAPCHCDQLRAELAAANAEAERLKAAHAIVPDEVEHTFKELRVEYAELRENIDGWTKQCRALEPLVANRRDGESIIGAAAKEIEQLRAENAALRAWLGRDAIYAEIQQQAVESIERILRGDAEAK